MKSIFALAAVLGASQVSFAEEPKADPKAEEKKVEEKKPEDTKPEDTEKK